MHKNLSIAAVIFDWAGTTVDYGSHAPSAVFAQVFAQHGVKLTAAQINGPMGLEKKAHIRSLLSLETAKEQWQTQYAREATEEDINTLYEEFEDTLFKVVADRAAPLAGVVETVSALRAQGIKIGSTTGYNSKMMEQVLPTAKAHGYCPDCVVTPDVVGGVGRPAPYMLFECMRRLNVFPPRAVLKVGDTIADVLEGKHAGALSVGLLQGSNILGFSSEEEYRALPADELKARKQAAAARYKEAGADFVLDSITQLPSLVAAINGMRSY